MDYKELNKLVQNKNQYLRDFEYFEHLIETSKNSKNFQTILDWLIVKLKDLTILNTKDKLLFEINSLILAFETINYETKKKLKNMYNISKSIFNNKNKNDDDDDDDEDEKY